MLLPESSPLINILISSALMIVFTGAEVSRARARPEAQGFAIFDRVITLIVDVCVDLVLLTTILTAIAVWSMGYSH